MPPLTATTVTADGESAQVGQLLISSGRLRSEEAALSYINTTLFSLIIP